MRALRTLSNRGLASRLDTIRKWERKLTIDVVVHLAELDRRGYYRDLGYGSLFEYCRRRLGYSESAANRRIRTARCVRAHPGLLRRLESGETNITIVSMIASVINENNAEDLLAQIAGKSQNEVEGILAGYRPGRAPVRDRIQPIRVERPAAPSVAFPLPARSDRAAGSGGVTTGDHAASENGACGGGENRGGCVHDVDSRTHEWQEVYRRSGGKKLAASEMAKPPTSATRETSATEASAGDTAETHYKIMFGGDPEFMVLYREVCRLMASRDPRKMRMQDVLKATMKAYIDRHSPEAKAKRRAKRANGKPADKTPAEKEPTDGGRDQTKRTADAARSRGAEALHKPQRPASAAGAPQRRVTSATSGTRDTSTGSRVHRCAIPKRVRERVIARDGRRCTYMSTTGVRCSQTRGLQVDHIVPVARGGRNTPDNLRVLCASHNRLEAERAFGRRFVEAKVKKNGTGRSP